MNVAKKQTTGVNARRPSKTGSHERQFCNYMHRICLQPRLDGYEFCIRHILEDKSAPYRQCAFTHAQSGRRCSHAAPKTDKRESLCQWHAKKALQHRRSSSRKQHLVETPQKVLESLEHYCQDQQHSTEQSENARNTVKFYDIESDEEPPTVDETWQYDGDSEAESVDNEPDELLKHAGVYTAEEASMITRDKLIRLQSLYLEQFKRLQHVLKEKRRDYLRRRSDEMETTTGITKTFSTPAEERMYQRYKAYYRYHRSYGVEAVLKRQLKLRQKATSEGSSYPPPSKPSCIFNVDGHRCGQKVLPFSKYCPSHVLSDPQQVLFKKCADKENECNKPVIHVPSLDSCLLHVVPTCSKKSWTSSAGPGTYTDVDIQEPEHFQSMDDIAALGLDVVQPGSLFGLNQFGDPGESTDSALSDDGMMQPLGLGGADILCDARKPSFEVEK